VPHAVRSLSRLVALGLAASLIATGVAFAAEDSKTGGAQAAPAAEKVSVEDIQRALGVRADGVLGPKTRRAIKRFQRKNGLAVTGVADEATLVALGVMEPEDRSLAEAPEDEDDPATVLAKIAECESGGDITAISPDRRYRGKYQFSRATWKALGGTGDPAKADEATQDAMALKLYEERGTAPWPNCA
jgi:peptidoglycan hydrolase-like protein with peptidoglycan-binding domain